MLAKIVIKRGVQLTTSERMAEDLKVKHLCSSCYLLSAFEAEHLISCSW